MLVKIRLGTPKTEKVYNLSTIRWEDASQKDISLRCMVLNMKQVEEEIKEESKEGKVLPFTVYAGGKGPTNPNWLSNLNKGTVFLCRPKPPHQGFFLAQHHVIFKHEKGVLLLDNSNGTDVYFTVDPVRFCNQMELFEVIQKGEDEE